MSRPIAVLFCPGRGSYGRAELGSIRRHLRPGPVADALAEADQARAAEGRPTVSALDAADGFRPGLHLEGRNAAELIYFATMAWLEQARERYEIVAVAGNSLGWYTALSAAGAMTPRDGWALVAAMARLQQLAEGGQVLTTTVDPTSWLPDPALERAVDGALLATNARGPDHLVARSIRLGGHEVLAGTELGVAELLRVLPKVASGEREFPFRLAGHGPFHTELCAEVAREATRELAVLPVREPGITLIDGRGDQHTPWSGDPRHLRFYTTDTQVRTTFDFSAAVRVAIREFCPDVLLCAAPGTSLRAPVGHVVLRERYRGIATRDALFASDLVRTD
jgi:acyl transferase domain-containing protein